MECRCSIRRVVIFAVTASAALMTGCGAHSLQNSPQPNSSASLATTIDSLAKQQMQQNGIPGMVVELAKRGVPLYVQSYGVRNLASGDPAQTGTIYEIGSITKQFTAALILKLQEQGKLTVNDPIAGYLPQYGFPSTITIRMCLTHTSGLADYTNFPQINEWATNGVSEATILTAIGNAPLQFQPGTRYAYSNSNYYVLGAIIEAITGQSYQANLQQTIFQPLALRSTYYTVPPPDRSATGYTGDGMGLVAVAPAARSVPFAAGAISTDAADLIVWDEALISGKIISQKSFDEMTTSNGFVDSGGNSYGFGVALYTFGSHPIEWHDGQTAGFYAENVVFLDDGFMLVVLTNDADVNTDPFVLKIMNAVCNSATLSGTC